MRAAKVLFNSVKKRVSKVIPEVLARVAPKRAEDLARNVANQLVNCMAFNDCGNIGDRWRKGVGTGSTISPDNLMDIMHTMWRAATHQGPAHVSLPLSVGGSGGGQESHLLL